MKRVAVVTGTRAEYGLLRSSMEAIERTEGLSLSVIATGMHLSSRYGSTVEEIRDDGFGVDHTVSMLLEGDTGLTMAKSTGIGVMGLAEAFGSLEPDVVLVLGDRDEAFAGAVAAAHMNVPVAHVHGGDSMHGAIIDDSIRHAITKFAHVHFPVSERSHDRIVKLGEQEWRIEVVGAPGLDAVIAGEYDPPEVIFSKHDVPEEPPTALVVQHPVTTQPDEAGDQMRATLTALSAFDIHAVVVYPNSDAGGNRMIDVIDEYDDREWVTSFNNLPRSEFLGAMAGSDVMVGNSSSAIIEAPSFGLPAVDIGPRQRGRERAENTVRVPHDSDRIRDAVRDCLEDESVRRRAARCRNPYDYGGAGERIATHLSELEIDRELLRKRLTY